MLDLLCSCSFSKLDGFDVRGVRCERHPEPDSRYRSLGVSIRSYIRARVALYADCHVAFRAPRNESGAVPYPQSLEWNCGIDSSIGVMFSTTMFIVPSRRETVPVASSSDSLICCLKR